MKKRDSLMVELKLKGECGPCGSGFTRECGGDSTIAFAGEPAPTGYAAGFRA
ncbi:hypothetical protein PPUN12996_02640 [Pseudomonas putida]|nr:hypothetical protein PPUN12996_02640 [Pseudomonas putida]